MEEDYIDQLVERYELNTLHKKKKKIKIWPQVKKGKPSAKVRNKIIYWLVHSVIIILSITILFVVFISVFSYLALELPSQVIPWIYISSYVLAGLIVGLLYREYIKRQSKSEREKERIEKTKRLWSKESMFD